MQAKGYIFITGEGDLNIYYLFCISQPPLSALTHSSSRAKPRFVSAVQADSAAKMSKDQGGQQQGFEV
jgi:hypothetical protein